MINLELNEGKKMKRHFIAALLFAIIVSTSFGQKIDFSANLTSDGGVHTNNSSVTDNDGNIFIAGGTRDGLQVTDNAFQTSYKGHSNWAGGDIFLMKLSPAGELIYSTYIGCTGSEYYCEQITLDDFGNVLLGITTDSEDLPVSKNAFQKISNGDNEHYIIKFTNDCKYIASTYLGGSGDDHWSRLTVHNNTLYLFGKTKSVDFPITPNALQKEYKNFPPIDSTRWWCAGDISITALSLDLDKIYYSTYLGGKSMDYVSSYSFKEDGKIILAGGTYSVDFPTTINSFDRAMAGETDGFITIVDKELSKIEYSTLIGGKSADKVNSIVSDNSNNFILVGETKSHDFPVTSDALNEKFLGGRADGFIMKLNVNSNDLIYSSFLGGSGSDRITEVEITDKQKYLLVGRTGSKDFPVTEDALQKSNNGGADLVVLKLDKTLKNIEYSTYLGGSKHERSPNSNFTLDNKLIISFISQSPDLPVTKKYAEIDSTNMNALLKIDLSGK